MATNNSTNFNSADFDVTAGVFELTDEVVKTVATDSGSATPSAHGFTITATGGATTSAAGSTVTVDCSGVGGIPTDLDVMGVWGYTHCMCESSANPDVGWCDVGAPDTSSEAGHPGIFELASTDYLASCNSMLLSDGQVMYDGIIRLDGAEGGPEHIGFCDSKNPYPPSNGVYFRFVSGSNWEAVTEDADSETSTDTGLDFDNSWHRFQIFGNATNTSFTFYVDGVLKATHTTNIPSVALYVTHYARSTPIFVDAALYQQTL